MFLLFFNRSCRYRFDKKLFSSQVAEHRGKNEEIADIKTFVDKKQNILRRTSNSVWESIIGLEVHAQINAKSKMFSSAPHQFNSPVNSNVSYFDASIPGTLPVLNRQACWRSKLNFYASKKQILCSLFPIILNCIIFLKNHIIQHVLT